MKKRLLKSNVFGRLTVIGLDHLGYRDLKFWKLSCSCGGSTVASTSDLNAGKRKSCGCVKREKLIKRNTKHGQKGTRLYAIWQGMIRRCHNENATDYKNYGARGISVCDEWRYNFRLFFEWATVSGYKDCLTIERIDNDGNYYDDNCTWIPKSEQSKNRRIRDGFPERGKNGRFTKTISG